IVDHVRDQTFGRSIFGIAGDELLLVLALEELKNARPVPDDFEVRIIHRQLSESEDTATKVNVRRRTKRGLEDGWAAPGIKELDNLAIRNADACDATFQVWRRRQGLRRQDDIIALNLHSPRRILVHQL